MQQKNKRSLGTKYEEKAAKYLEEQGYEILDRNFMGRRGEIDLIAKKDGILVFAEVKYRRQGSFGHPFEAVDNRKKKRMICCVVEYLYLKGISQSELVRFDVIGFEGEKIFHLENAFLAGE